MATRIKTNAGTFNAVFRKNGEVAKTKTFRIWQEVALRLAKANEVKRNRARATDCGEEAWSINREPMDKNWIEGAAEQGERARSRETLVAKAKRRKSGGCAVKADSLTQGDLALRLKGRRHRMAEREVSRGRIRLRERLKARTRRRTVRP